MPNWVTNRLTLVFDSYEEAYNAKEYFKTGANDFDFNKVIKMPEESETFKATGDLTMEDHKKENWYDWSIEHWGTKWNSYEARCRIFSNVLVIDFLTAWNTISNEMQLHIVFDRRCNLKLEWYDEDLGSNCGRIEMDFHKKETQSYIPADHNEGIQFIYDTFGVETLRGDGWEYLKIDGVWKFREI